MSATVTQLRPTNKLTAEDIKAILASTSMGELKYRNIRDALPQHLSVTVTKLLVEMSHRKEIYLGHDWRQLNDMSVRLPR